jgi:hypothetical protein
MNSSGHDQDRLLDYAYDELPPSEAKSLEVHLKSCAQCSRALDDIRKVRRTMAQLPTVQAPAAGLDSLLAYAQQAARRAEAGPVVRSRLWKWLLLPSAGALVMVLLLVSTVSIRVARETDLSGLKSAAAPKVAPPPSAPPTLSASPSSSPPAEPLSDDAIDRQSASAGHDVLGAGPAVSRRVKSLGVEAKDFAAKAESKSPAKVSVNKPPSRPEPKGAGASVQTSPVAEAPAAGPQLRRLGPPTAEEQRAAAPQANLRESTLAEQRAAAPQSMLLRESTVADRQVAAPQVMPPREPPIDDQRAAASQAVAQQLSTPHKLAAPKQAPQEGRSRLAKSAALSDESLGTARGAASNEVIVTGSRPRAPAGDQSQPALEKDIARTRDMLRNEKVVGLERAWLLNHLCEQLYAANHLAEADSTCDQVIRDFPGSAAADAARQLKAKNLKDQPR